MSAPARKPPGRRLRYAAEIAGLRLVIAVMRSLSIDRALALGAALGRFAHDVVGLRREVARENVRLTIGRAWPESRVRGIVRATYENFGRSLAEYCSGPRLDRAHVERNVTFEGLEHLDAALARGKGVILVSGHYGAWQYLGGALSLRGYAVNYLLIEQHNAGVDRIQNEIAGTAGVKFIYPGAGLRGILTALRRNEIVVILADQHASGGGVIMDFLGRRASIAQGPASLSLRTGAPMVPAFMIREAGPRHRIVVRPAIEAVPLGGDPAADVAHYTRAHAAVLEEFIHLHPEHWLWMHRRWKAANQG